MTDVFEHLDLTVCGRREILLLVGQGVEDRDKGIPYGEEYFLEDMDGIQIPDPPTRLGSGRLTIRNFSSVVHVLSPTTVRTVFLVGNFNPNLPLTPQSLLDFIMQKMCGVVFSKLQHGAKKAPPVSPIQQDDTLTFANCFYYHGRCTRFVVTLILVVVLLVALYSDVLLGFKSKLRKHGNSIWMNSILDIATFVYMGMTAAIHFVMCTVSLVYAYENLALGQKLATNPRNIMEQTFASWLPELRVRSSHSVQSA